MHHVVVIEQGGTTVEMIALDEGDADSVEPGDAWDEIIVQLEDAFEPYTDAFDATDEDDPYWELGDGD